MSKIRNGGLDQYSAEPFEQQQFGTAGVEGVNLRAAHECVCILNISWARAVRLSWLDKAYSRPLLAADFG